MLVKVSLAAGLVLAAATLAPIGASAATAPQSPLPGATAADGSLVQKAQWGGYCRSWRTRVRGALGLAYAGLLPLHGSARLLKCERCQTPRV